MHPVAFVLSTLALFCGVGFLYAAILFLKLTDGEESAPRRPSTHAGEELAKRARQLFVGRRIDPQMIEQQWRTQPQVRSAVKLGLAFVAVAGAVAALGVLLK